MDVEICDERHGLYTHHQGMARMPGTSVVGVSTLAWITAPATAAPANFTHLARVAA
jgi:hypothetical protein